VPIARYADAMMCTRGILRSSIPAAFQRGIVLRASGGPSVLKELSNERLVVDIEEAARMNVHDRADGGTHTPGVAGKIR